MRLDALRNKIKTPMFFDYQVARLFHEEPIHQIVTQLSRLVRRGSLVRLKRGFYAFPEKPYDDLVLAHLLYQPSFISLETALHSFGMLPEVVAQVTSLTTTTSKKITTRHGVYRYSKISSRYYFGFEYHQDTLSEIYYPIAFPEKALLDLIYVRKVRKLTEYRLELNDLDRAQLMQYALLFPAWVRRVIDE